MDFRELVDFEYWGACHDAEDDEAEARLYVDSETGVCGCCGVDYRNEVTRPHLAALAEEYPNNVLVRYFVTRPLPKTA